VTNTDFPLTEAERLPEAGQRYQQLLAHLPIALYSCNPEGRITDFNPAAEALWGAKPDAGKRWTAAPLYYIDGRPMAPDKSPMARALVEGDEVSEKEFLIDSPEGKKWMRVVPSLIQNTQGQIQDIVFLLLDLSEEKKSEKNTAYLAAIVASSDDAIVSKDLDGIVTSWNQGAERIFGYTAEEMTGKHISLLIPPDRQQEEPLILERLRQGERVDHFETRRVTKDGRLIDVSLTISPIKSADGHVIGASKVARDITAQKRAEKQIRENESRFRLAVSLTQLGTWEYNIKEDSIILSPECRDIYQFPHNLDLNLEFLQNHTHPEDQDDVAEALKEALNPASGGEFNIQYRIIRLGDQATRWIHVQGLVYFDSAQQPEKVLCTVVDISREYTDKLELEQKIEERTRNLREANLQLEESNRDLEQFAFIASHDLQEPLRKIQAFGDLLKARLSEESGDEVKDLINRMQSASSRMKTLIDSLLSFSRLSFSHNPPQHVNLNKLLDSVLADLETSIKDAQAEIEIGRLYPVSGEPLQLRQLFQNLIANALKFSKKGESPKIEINGRLVTGENSGITVTPEDLKNSFQLIEVQDHGIGFEEEYAHKIFQLFQRLHGKTEYPGSGVGLSIVQKVVNNHDGYISAVGEPGAGANFRILLPFTI
jgi:PAS domain S-box-containing protein